MNHNIEYLFWKKHMQKKSPAPLYSKMIATEIQTTSNAEACSTPKQQDSSIIYPVKKQSIAIEQPVNVTSKSKKSEENSFQAPDFVKSNTLPELRMELAKLDLPFKQYATTMVFSDGDSESPLMFIGEAPGQEEDKQGKPFVGESGKLLESMLNAGGIYRKNYYITNILPWRPPNNRTPLPNEIKLMQPYILNHIEIINPKIVVLIGSVAYKAVMNETKAITSVRGDFIECNGRLYMPVFHPSYLLRSPSKKKEMWHDVLTLKNKIIEQSLNILQLN